MYVWACARVCVSPRELIYLEQTQIEISKIVCLINLTYTKAVQKISSDKVLIWAGRGQGQKNRFFKNDGKNKLSISFCFRKYINSST